LLNCFITFAFQSGFGRKIALRFTDIPVTQEGT